jgi:DNA-binding XRE family transcriptional regulator
MDLGLPQRRVAEALGANPWTYLLWEHDRTQPTPRFVPPIVRFLGYDPFPNGQTLGDRLRAARKRLGLTHRELGARLGLSASTVYEAERGRSRPACPGVLRIAQFLRVS